MNNIFRNHTNKYNSTQPIVQYNQQSETSRNRDIGNFYMPLNFNNIYDRIEKNDIKIDEINKLLTYHKDLDIQQKDKIKVLINYVSRSINRLDLNGTSFFINHIHKIFKKDDPILLNFLSQLATRLSVDSSQLSNKELRFLSVKLSKFSNASAATGVLAILKESSNRLEEICIPEMAGVIAGLNSSIINFKLTQKNEAAHYLLKIADYIRNAGKLRENKLIISLAASFSILGKESTSPLNSEIVQFIRWLKDNEILSANTGFDLFQVKKLAILISRYTNKLQSDEIAAMMQCLIGASSQSKDPWELDSFSRFIKDILKAYSHFNVTEKKVVQDFLFKMIETIRQREKADVITLKRLLEGFSRYFETEKPVNTSTELVRLNRQIASFFHRLFSNIERTNISSSKADDLYYLLNHINFYYTICEKSQLSCINAVLVEIAEEISKPQRLSSFTLVQHKKVLGSLYHYDSFIIPGNGRDRIAKVISLVFGEVFQKITVLPESESPSPKLLIWLLVVTICFRESFTPEDKRRLTLQMVHLAKLIVEKKWFNTYTFDFNTNLVECFVNFKEYFSIEMPVDVKTCILAIIEKVLTDAISEIPVALPGDQKEQLKQSISRLLVHLNDLEKEKIIALVDKWEGRSVDRAPTESLSTSQPMEIEAVTPVSGVEAFFLPSNHPELSRNILKIITENKFIIQGEFRGHGGQFAIDISQHSMLWIAFSDLAQKYGRDLYEKALSYFGIYNSTSNSAKSPTSPFPSSPKLHRGKIKREDLLKMAEKSFLKTWIYEVERGIDGLPSDPSKGLALVKIAQNTYHPVEFTRENCPLNLCSLSQTGLQRLAELGFSYKEGSIKIEDPLFARNKEGVMVLEDASRLHHPHNTEVLGKRPTGDRMTGLRSINESTNPFFSKKRKITQETLKSSGSTKQGSRTGRVEEVQQRQQVGQTIQEVVSIQMLRQERTQKELDRGKIALVRTLFTSLSEQEVTEVVAAFSSESPIAIDRVQLEDPKTLALMVLWILSGDKCWLGLSASDVTTFEKVLSKQLKDLKSSPLALLLAQDQLSVGELAMGLKKKCPSLKLRLEFCSLIRDPLVKKELYLKLAKWRGTPSRSQRDLGWSAEDVKAFGELSWENKRQRLQTLQVDGCGLAIAEHYVNQHRLSVLKLDEAVECARSLQEFNSVQKQFIITSRQVLHKALKDASLDDVRLLLPLSEPSGLAQLKCKQLAVVSDRMSGTKQCQLLELLGVGRITHRMKRLVDQLSTGTPNKIEYLELLAWCMLAKAVLNQTWLLTHKKTNDSIDRVTIQVEASDKDAFSKRMEKIQEKMRGLLQSDERTKAKIKESIGQHPDLLYVVSSKAPNLGNYLDRLKSVLRGNGFKVQIKDGNVRPRARVLQPYTGDGKRITLMTNEVLPLALPHWPVILDPTLKNISYFKQANVQGITQFVADFEGSFEEASLVEACFGSGDIAMLQEQTKAYLIQRLKDHQTPAWVIQAVEQITLSEKEVTAIQDVFEKEAVAPTPLIPQPVLQNGDILAVEGRQLRLHRVPMDGSCLFSCLIRGHVNPNLTSVLNWRKELATYLEQHCKVFAMSLSDHHIKSIKKILTVLSRSEELERVQALARNYEDQETKEELMRIYIDLLKTTGMWGTDFEIAAAVNLFHKPIKIVSQTADGFQVTTIAPEGGVENDPVYFLFDGQHYDFFEIV